jgi:hypothetical protein
MDDEELAKSLHLLLARTLATRDVVARLVAYEAARWPDPTKMYEDFSDATAQHLHEVTAGRPLSPGSIALQEAIQKEVDWIVAVARRMGDEDKES